MKSIEPSLRELIESLPTEGEMTLLDLCHFVRRQRANYLRQIHKEKLQHGNPAPNDSAVHLQGERNLA